MYEDFYNICSYQTAYQTAQTIPRSGLNKSVRPGRSHWRSRRAKLNFWSGPSGLLTTLAIGREMGHKLLPDHQLCRSFGRGYATTDSKPLQLLSPSTCSESLFGGPQPQPSFGQIAP